MRWVGHLARMKLSRNAYKILVGNPEEKRPLERPRRMWEDNIKMDLRKVHWLRVFENKVLRKISWAKRDEITGEWTKLHNAELHALYSSPNIIRNLKSGRLRWAGHVARMEQFKNA